MKLPTGYILLEARLRGPMRGPAALVAWTGNGVHGVAPEAILLGAADAGHRLCHGRAFRIVGVPEQSVETSVLAAGAEVHGPIALTAKRCGVGRMLWHVARCFPAASARCLGLALAGRWRLARLKLAYVLQGPAQPISYATLCALFEHDGGPPSPERSPVALIVIGDPGSSVVRITLYSIAAMATQPVRSIACADSGGDLRACIAQMLDDPSVTHVGVVAGGDSLARGAVGRVAACLEEISADLVYADHDLLDAAGHRHSPAFKPAWNKPLALTGDLLAGLTVLRKDLVRAHDVSHGACAAAAWRELLLRAATRPGVRIAHIPRVLCHLAGRAEASPSLEERCAIALRVDAATGLQASATIAGNRMVRRLSPRGGASVSIIVPTACKRGVADRCLPRILADTAWDQVEFIIAAHKRRLSQPYARDLLERLRQDARVKIVWHDIEPFNYAAVNNLAARAADGEVLCLLNDDVTPIRPDWLQLMLGELSDPSVGAVGARLLYPNGWVQHMGLVMGLMGRAEHWQRFTGRADPGYLQRAQATQDVSAVTGACLLVRSMSYRALIGLDEAFAVSFNDVDLCLKLRETGWRIVLCAEAELVHDETASFGAGTPERAQVVADELIRFRSRWWHALRDDPHFSPNLSLETASGWALAVPPRDRRPRLTVVK
jgi:GT2 family glycosyltransferase